MYIIVNFVSKNIFKSKDHVRNMLESGLTYVLLSIKLFRKLIVKLRLID
jgi:hypothetical protein